MQATLTLEAQQAVRAAAGIVLFMRSLPLFRNIAAIRQIRFDADTVKRAVEGSMQSIGASLLLAALFA